MLFILVSVFADDSDDDTDIRVRILRRYLGLDIGSEVIKLVEL